MSHAQRLSELNRQIMWHRLIAVVEEQAQSLIRTAFSPIVRECGDVSAGVFDIQGRMLAQAVTGTPGHINSMAASVKHFIRHFPIETMRSGDVYVMNDPWLGTGHLNDFVVTTPVFHRDRLLAIFSCTSHLTDIGGLGFGPDGTDVYMEGLSVPFLRLFDQGRLNETLIAILKQNSRLPVDAEGDVYSLANCNEIGGRRLIEMMDEFHVDTLDSLAEHILAASQAAVLERIRALPRGTFHYSMMVDGYEEPIRLAAALTIGAQSIEVDFTGTSPASRRGINVPLIYTTAYTVFGLTCAIAPEIPSNAGSLAPFRVTAPEGTILNALRPAPVSARHVIGQMMPDVVFGCLSHVLPERVPVEGTSCLWNMMFRGRGADPFSITVVTNGGTGARPNKDGLSATAYPSGVKGSPIETVEAATPLLFWKKELRAGSGGNGRFRGGNGLEMEIENRSNDPVELLAAFDRLHYPARGRNGGGNGARGEIYLKDSARALAGKGLQEVPPGTRLVVRTPGGGGIGSPSERPDALKARDAAHDVLQAGDAR